MDIQTSPDPVARARELGAEIVAAADEIERTRRIPEALLERLHASRLFRMLLPRSAGGDETEPALYVAAIEELARHDASIAWNVFVANSSCLIAAYLEPAVNHAVFADPRSIVAWGPPNASRARAVDAGYRLTGKWDFASGCRQARWMGAHCHVLEADGTLRLNRFGRPTVRTLLFPASEATLLDTWRTIGLRGTASDSYCVNDVVRVRGVQHHARGPDAAPRARPALCLYHAVPLRDRGRRCGIWHRARDAVRVHRAGVPQGAARPRPARRQRGRAGRRGARRGAARLGARLSDRDAHHDLRACRRCGADRGSRSGPRAARLHQRDPGRRPRWQTSPTRERASTRSSRAARSSAASATCTRSLSRSRHAAPISSRSGRSCSACRPRCFFE